MKPPIKPRSRSRLSYDPLDGTADVVPQPQPDPAATPSGPAQPPERSDTVTTVETATLNWSTMLATDALNFLSNPIMIADSNMVIRYVNEAGYKMFEAIEVAIRQDLPHFIARSVVGKTIDVFHKNPVYQRRIMENMIAPHDGKFTIGGKSLAFKATPIFGVQGGLDFVFVEWQDRTFAVERQAQLDAMVGEITKMTKAHADGAISFFINSDGFDPEYKLVVEGVNTMVQGHIDTKKKVIRCVSEFADGNFDADIEPLSGERVFINDAINKIRDSFKRIFGEIERFSAGLESGDLATKVNDTGFSGDFKRLVTLMEGALVNLNATMTNATQQVQQVSITVEQMSQASQSLATNSQIQSSSVDEVSASAEQTNIQVKSNATSAEAASKLVSGTAIIAEEGTQKISEMVSAMEGIRASSQDIAKIIKVIDEIAFQTNLLALNAAVEAARAGQHGRGFAVVAQEVRNLAGRSAKAARETSDLIEDAGTRVRKGVTIADETRAAFSKIAGDVKQVQTLVKDIAVASEEQARGVTQINVAIGEVAKSALATSQQADELAASAAEMQSATETMQKDFSRFRLRPVSAPKTSAIALDSLSPDMLAQLRRMLMTEGAANGEARRMNGAVSNTDRDERGFANF